MASSTTLWNTRYVYFSDTKHVRRDGLQGYSCRTTDGLFHGVDMNEAGVPSVTFPLPFGHTLDNEDDHRN